MKLYNIYEAFDVFYMRILMAFDYNVAISALVTGLFILGLCTLGVLIVNLVELTVLELQDLVKRRRLN